MHKITPYKLFNTKFNIGLNTFLTRAQHFHVNVGLGGGGGGGGGWRYSEQLSFLHSAL